jgi:hypothetical protein
LHINTILLILKTQHKDWKDVLMENIKDSENTLLKMSMGIKKYVKKPLAIEAMQFINQNYLDVSNFIGDFPHKVITSEEIILIHTLEGDHIVREGDYVIKGVFDEFYPCKPDIFKSTYEEFIN